jgi:hypothetical protein
VASAVSGWELSQHEKNASVYDSPMTALNTVDPEGGGGGGGEGEGAALQGSRPSYADAAKGFSSTKLPPNAIR